MSPQEDILFLTEEEMITELEECGDLANREFAHQRADEILVVALLRATSNELSHAYAVEMVRLYQGLDRRYG